MPTSTPHPHDDLINEGKSIYTDLSDNYEEGGDSTSSLGDDSLSTLLDAAKVSTLTATELDSEGLIALFQELVVANREHLDKDFKQGRMDNADYVKVHTAIVQASMNTSLQFYLEKDKNILAQEAMIQDIIGKQLDNINKQLTAGLLQKDNEVKFHQVIASQADSAIKKLSLVLTERDIHLKSIQTTTAEYNLETTLPAQTKILTQEELNLKERVLVAKQEVLSAQKQVESITKDIAIKDYQLGTLLPIKGQVELSQISDTYTLGNSTKTVAGSVKIQKDLQVAQKNSFIADNKYRFTKLLSDSYSLSKSIDPATPIPTYLAKSSIDKALLAMASELGMTIN